MQRYAVSLQESHVGSQVIGNIPGYNSLIVDTSYYLIAHSKVQPFSLQEARPSVFMQTKRSKQTEENFDKSPLCQS